MSNELECGLQAINDGHWIAARDAFTQALSKGETPKAHGGLADALWWL